MDAIKERAQKIRKEALKGTQGKAGNKKGLHENATL